MATMTTPDTTGTLTAAPAIIARRGSLRSLAAIFRDARSYSETEAAVREFNAQEREEAAPRGRDLAAALTAVADAAVDAHADTRLLSIEATPANDDGLPPADRVRMVVQSGGSTLPLRLLDGAHDQLAEKVGIPAKYWKRMVEHAPELAAENANHWLAAEPERRLLRMLRPITDADGTAMARVGAQFSVRAVLSDKYRTLDNYALFNALLPVMEETGAHLAESDIGERRFHARFALGGVDVFALARAAGVTMADFLAANGFKRGEWLRFGVSVRNSETGHAGLAVEPWAQVIRCMNGMVVAESLKVRHVGRRAEEDESAYSAETRIADDTATFLKVRDQARAAIGEASQMKAARLIAGAAGVELPRPEDIPAFEFIGNIGARFDLTEREVAAFTEEASTEMANNPWGPSRLSPWTISQAMTATARRIGDGDIADGAASYERKVELERVGFTILESSAQQLARMGAVTRAAAARRAARATTSARRNN